MINYLIIFTASLLLSIFLIYIFSWMFSKLGIIDNPAKYGLNRLPIPYSMGVIFFVNFFILSYVFVDHFYKLYLIWGFGLIITIISFIDDKLEVKPQIRLIIQILIGAMIGLTSIKIGYISNIFGGIINLETYNFEILSHTIYIIPLIFTIIWYVLIFNSLNWSDGVPGLTSGLSLISFFIIFLLAFILFHDDTGVELRNNSEFIMQISLILIGSLIIFRLYDSREKILMGDSGTMFLGFMLATLAIISGGKIATVVVVLGIYIVDAFYVVLGRLLSGKSPFKKDFTHLHHRLMEIGLSKNQILGIIYILSLLFGLSALFLDKIGKIIVFFIIIFVVISLSTILDKIYKNKT